MSDDEDPVLRYQDSLWIDDHEIAFHKTEDKRYAATPWSATWVRPDGSMVRVNSVTKDRSILLLMRKLDIEARNSHLGDIESSLDGDGESS